MIVAHAYRLRNPVKRALRRFAAAVFLVNTCAVAAPAATPSPPESPAAVAHPSVAPAPVAASSATAVSPAPVVAAKATGIDAILVLDSSGSMKHTDPLNLRLPAAKLFIALLGNNDRAGVVSFSDRATTLAELIALNDPAGRQKLLRAVDRVTSNGLFTDLHDAVAKARAMLGAPQSERPRYIILMSDGRMDTGDAARDQQLIAALHDVEIPALVKARITLYSIAFTQESDIPLLKNSAEATHGQFRLARLDKDLHDVFTSLFESAKTPDMLPIEGGEFHADDAIQEVTVVASKENPKVQIFLQTPQGVRLTASDAGREHYKELRWFSSAAFDMITLPHPLPGTWKVLFSNGRNKAYIVTDLGIVTDLKKRDFQRGDTLTITAALQRGSDIVRQPEILASTQFTLQMQAPDGRVNEFMMRDTGQLGDKTANDGIYTATVPLITPGQQKLHLVARSATFQRETTRDITVAVPARVVTPLPPAVKASPKHQATPAVPPRVVEPGVNIGWLISGFLLFNLLIGAGVGAVLWWRGRRTSTGKVASVVTAAPSVPPAPAEHE